MCYGINKWFEFPYYKINDLYAMNFSTENFRYKFFHCQSSSCNKSSKLKGLRREWTFTSIFLRKSFKYQRKFLTLRSLLENYYHRNSSDTSFSTTNAFLVSSHQCWEVSEEREHSHQSSWENLSNIRGNF
jgi:hypothetical protein